MDKPILSMGASSGIGKCAVDEALSRDLPVRAFARRADNMSTASGLQPYPGDALNPAGVDSALTGYGQTISLTPCGAGPDQDGR